MCGIAGILSLSGEPVSYGVIKKMTDILHHRGPDDEGVFLKDSIALGHRRLSILDLSKAGQQPMGNSDGSVVLTYNGEIYNFKELRLELSAAGFNFRSQTDSEVVLNAYQKWGDQFVNRLNGMFAFAIWDNKNRKLILARDRFGVKPLYIFNNGKFFAFASEVKALLQHPEISAKISYPALNEYFTFQNTFSELTLFEGINLLSPGTIVTVSAASGAVQQKRYWNYTDIEVDHALKEEDCVEQVRSLLTHAIVRQLQSDTPVGAYLSGGIDSSAIVATAAKNLPRLTTFTAGFDLSSASGLELAFDERQKAEVLANLFKTEHYEVVLHAGDMEWVISNLIWHLEDLRVGQCYPNYYVANLASKFVKVVLSGAGGDELFAGYPWRYFLGEDNENSEQYFGRYFQRWQRLVNEEEKGNFFNSNTHRSMNGHSAFDSFRNVFKEWDRPLTTSSDRLEASLYFELKTFLHGLLVVEDKLSMAHSLESRVPFLDNDLVDFSLRIPSRFKIPKTPSVDRINENTPGKRLLVEQSAEGKQVLRKALSTVVPKELSERFKQGFSAPDASWFRGESINYINTLLRTPSARVYEFLNPEAVAGILDQHCSGKKNMRLLIWSLLSFEHLLRRFF